MARRARSSRTKGQKNKQDRKVPKSETTGMAQDIEKGAASRPEKDDQKKEVQKKVSRKDTRKGSSIRDWYYRNQTTIFILLGIFILAFLIREFFYYQISFNTWPPNIVGNDPSYHKRVIDFVQSDYTHLKIDGLLNYPISGGNPRPPIFDWSIAVMGIVLSPFFGFNVENSTWVVFQFAPTFWGALTIFPMYLLGKETFGRKAGIMAAFLLAITSSHIERSTLGFTDHDSFIVFFVVLSMYFLAKAFYVQKDKHYISDWRRSDSVLLGFRAFILENREALGYAFLVGISISTIALTWQGYAYVLAIMLIYYMIQLLIHRFRNEDSLGTFMVIFIAMFTVVLLSLPYYFVFSIATWSQGFYILLAMTVLGIFIVPTRDVPWLLVIPTLGLFLVVSYFILQWGFPETANLLFTGGGYFVSNKLYDTIAEAQAPDISRVVFTYGPATFFLGLVGVVMAAIKIPKQMRKDYIVIVIWTAVAIYMAFSAIRFNFNATPAFALLAGWVVVKIVDYFKAEGLSIVYSIIAVILFTLSLFILREGWDNYLARNFLTVTMIPLVLGSVAYFAYMKYKKKRDYFKFRKILTALGIGFIVILPNVFFAVDAAIPIESKDDFDPELKYFGSFGSSLHSEYWMDSYRWLATQDIVKGNETVPPEERPAFMSWWDYGFDELLLGEHPTAADNFQNGYQFTGSMIASQNESEAIALMISRLLEGDWIENDGKFSDGIWSHLVKYLGDDKNSTRSAQEIERIYKRPGKYISVVMNNPDKYGKYDDITWPNARYAAARGAMMHLGEEGLVELYHDVRMETGKSLQYFAVDYRLFPFSASNTGIFYAPITLADRDVEDYLEYKVYAQENTRGSNEDPDWTDYPDNPISMDKAREESERLGYKFRIVQTEMFYTEGFYNSMFYKTYIGYSPSDVGSPMDGKSVPGFPGNLQNLAPMQGWNMTHWKLVYKTYYYSEKEEANASYPDDYEPMEYKKAVDLYNDKGGDIKSGLGQGVFYLRYYDGAMVSGRVRTERGVGVPGVRVTVLDDYGIPHGNVITGPNGEYSLIAPPGRANIVVTEGDLSNQYDFLYQFQIDQSTGQPSTLLNSTVLTISDDLAMRVVDGGRINRDLVISGKTLSGKIFWDLNGDSTYVNTDDELITRGEVRFELEGSSKVYGPFELNEDGTYSFEDMVPGLYDIIYTYGDKEETLIEAYKVDVSGGSTKDIRMDNTVVKGRVALESGLPAQEQTIIIEDSESETHTIRTDLSGNFSIDRLFPGVYDLRVDNPSFTHTPVTFELDQGDNLTYNITLLPRGDLAIKVYYPAGLRPSGISPSGTAPGSMIRISDAVNGSLEISNFLDEQGQIELVLPVGTYNVHIYSVERDQYWSFIGQVDVRWKESIRRTITLDPAIRVNGTLTKLAGSPMNGTTMLFSRQSDGAQIIIRTNSEGNYNTIIPRADYTIRVQNTTVPGNVTYFHLQDLLKPVRGNHVRLDIQATKTALVRGHVYWDRDLDREYGQGPDGDYQDLVDEGFENVDVLFEHPNGTVEFRTGSEGQFLATLPPGEYLMKVDIEGFEPFTREVEVPNTPEVMNFGMNRTDAFMEAKEVQFQMNFTQPYYGRYSIRNDPLASTEVVIKAMEPFREDEVWIRTTDGSGILTEALTPGDYSIEITERIDDDGIIHVSSLVQSVNVPPLDEMFFADLSVSHDVEYKGRVYLVDNSIVRYPPEIVVNFNAIQGQRVTIFTDQTDFNGEFSVAGPAGDYIMETHQDRPGTHYLYWDILSLDWNSEYSEFEMVQAFPVSGHATPSFRGIEDSEVFFEVDGLWISAELDPDGRFDTILLPGDYQANYTFLTVDGSLGEDVQVRYQHSSSFNVDAPVFDMPLEITKLVEVRGAVYFDENDDRTIQTHERREGAVVTFTEINGNEAHSTTSDLNGDYRIFLPFAEFQINVDLEGYLSSPREDLRFYDLPYEGLALWDVPLVPTDITVDGYIFYDVDGNGIRDEGERGVSGMEITFTPMEGSNVYSWTDEAGRFTALLPPDIYNVYGLSFENGKPSMGYLDELRIDLGEDMSGQEWPAVPARRISGTVFYRDTDGRLFMDPPVGEEITFSRTDGGEITTIYSAGTYYVDLPYYDYYISSRFTAEEYGMDMTYQINEQLTFNSTTQAADMALEFGKNKDHSFKMDLVKDYQHEIDMSPKETVRLEYYIENVGNEPFTVDVSVSEKPDGWSVEFPGGEGITLEIGERVTRWLNVTSPIDPNFTNSLVFQGESDQGSKNTFQMQIDTPPSFRFELSFDIPQVMGVDYDEMRVFNITVNNLGNGEDVVNIRMDVTDNGLGAWEVEWEGEPGFPAGGENASLLPLGVRRYAVTVRTPLSDDSPFYNERMTLTFTGKNRIGDVVEEKVVFEVRKPNLVLPPGFLKLTNRRLDDPVLNRTVEANITVKSLDRDARGVNVSLKIDGLVVAEGVIPYIPQDGTGHTRVRFNITEFNITEDDFHSLEVFIDPYDEVDETNDFDNAGIWKNVVIGDTPEGGIDVNWRIIIFVTVVLLVSLGIIAYRQKTQPI